MFSRVSDLVNVQAYEYVNSNHTLGFSTDAVDMSIRKSHASPRKTSVIKNAFGNLQSPKYHNT